MFVQREEANNPDIPPLPAADTVFFMLSCSTYLGLATGDGRIACSSRCHLMSPKVLFYYRKSNAKMVLVLLELVLKTNSTNWC
jgi:hypothetical protein